MEINTRHKEPINNGKFLLLSATGSKKSRIHASVVPSKINGIRFPIGVLTLSERVPKIGNKNKAKILSAAIIAPVNVSPIPKLFFKIKGIAGSQNPAADGNPFCPLAWDSRRDNGEKPSDLHTYRNCRQRIRRKTPLGNTVG